MPERIILQALHSPAIMSSCVILLSQVEAGSAAEGGRRFLLDCTDFDADTDRPGGGNWQEWVPLVYPDANGRVPYVLIRLPLQPQRPPTPDGAWKQGDRVEVTAVHLLVKRSILSTCAITYEEPSKCYCSPVLGTWLRHECRQHYQGIETHSYTGCLLSCDVCCLSAQVQMAAAAYTCLFCHLLMAVTFTTDM